MNNILKYKDYAARVEFDAEDGIFFGRIADIDDGVGFHGETVNELVAAFHEAVEDYLATCAAIGKAPEVPRSGRLMLRVSPEVHGAALKAARLKGQSLNAFGEAALEDAASRVLAG